MTPICEHGGAETGDREVEEGVSFFIHDTPPSLRDIPPQGGGQGERGTVMTLPYRIVRAFCRDDQWLPLRNRLSLRGMRKERSKLAV